MNGFGSCVRVLVGQDIRKKCNRERFLTYRGTDRRQKSGVAICVLLSHMVLAFSSALLHFFPRVIPVWDIASVLDPLHEQW